MKTEEARYDMKKGERVRDIETALPPLTRSPFSKVRWFLLQVWNKKSFCLDNPQLNQFGNCKMKLMNHEFLQFPGKADGIRFFQRLQ